MKNSLSILTLCVVLLVASCKSKKEEDPSPQDNMQEIACSSTNWSNTKEGSDSVYVLNGSLKIIANHTKSNGRNIITSTNPTCKLKGDFSVRVLIPSLKLSDTLDGGALYVNLSEVMYSFGGQSTTPNIVSTTITNMIAVAGVNKPSSFNFVTKIPTSAEVTFTRSGSNINAKLKYYKDSVQVSEVFNTNDLLLSIGASCDSAARERTIILVDKIVVIGGGGNLQSNDF